MDKTNVIVNAPSDFIVELQVAGCYCYHNGKILMVQRHPDKYQGNLWCLPGGKADAGEPIPSAAQRELLEETGIAIPLQHLQFLTKLFMQRPSLNFSFDVFLVVLETLPELQLQKEEIIDFKWVTYEEALELPLISGGYETLVLCNKQHVALLV